MGNHTALSPVRHVTFTAIIYLQDWAWVVVVVVVSCEGSDAEIAAGERAVEVDLKRSRKAPGEKAVLVAPKNRQIREQRSFHWRSAFSSH